jgi:hypothetical protein
VKCDGIDLTSGQKLSGGQAVGLHPTLLEPAKHNRLEPWSVAQGRGDQKPRVERSVPYVRGNFLAGEAWRARDHVQHEVITWCLTAAGT